MERVRGTLIILVCVLFCKHQRIFGTEVNVRVNPGDNITLFSDCVIPIGSHILWIRNNSYGNQSSVSMNAEDMFVLNFPRYSFVLNSSGNSFDLHIENISVYDEGVYYCAKAERKITTDVNGLLNYKFEFQYGNRRSLIAVLEPAPFEPPYELPELHCDCWLLLVIVCSVCVLISSLLSAACVYCLCRAQTTGSELNAEILKANVLKVEPTEKHQCEMSKAGKFCLHSEVTYRLLPSTNHPA